MRHAIRWLVVLAVCLASLGGRSASAQGGSFGLDDQVLKIGAAAFQAASSASGGYMINEDLGEDGFLYRLSGVIDSWFAPLHLPTGAEVRQICVYGFDNATGAGLSVSLEIVRLEFPGATVGTQEVITPVFLDVQSPPYGVACSPVVSYIFRQVAQGSLENIAHRLRVRILRVGNAGLGGVRVVWRRTVSPAPAAASFSDVPAGHPFFRFVEALAASGITAGCGAGRYCVDDPLTRGQMAVFLSIALGLHFEP
jgi:hypothetical protein